MAEGPGGPAARRSEGLYGRRGGSCHVPCRWRRAASRCLPSRGADGRARARARMPASSRQCLPSRGADDRACLDLAGRARAMCRGDCKVRFFRKFSKSENFARARKRAPIW